MLTSVATLLRVTARLPAHTTLVTSSVAAAAAAAYAGERGWVDGDASRPPIPDFHKEWRTSELPVAESAGSGDACLRVARRGHFGPGCATRHRRRFEMWVDVRMCAHCTHAIISLSARMTGWSGCLTANLRQ